MLLYDGKSALVWQGAGKLTAAKMRKDPRYSALFADRCVLFDNGEGLVYSYKPLAELCARYGVDEADPQAALERVEAAMQSAGADGGIEGRVSAIEAADIDRDEAIADLYEQLMGGAL